MEYYEKYYRENGLWERITKGMVDIDEYHKSKEYQVLSSLEKVIMDKEIEEMNRVIEFQIAFYPYGYESFLIEDMYEQSIIIGKTMGFSS